MPSPVTQRRYPVDWLFYFLIEMSPQQVKNSTVSSMKTSTGLDGSMTSNLQVKVFNVALTRSTANVAIIYCRPTRWGNVGVFQIEGQSREIVSLLRLIWSQLNNQSRRLRAGNCFFTLNFKLSWFVLTQKHPLLHDPRQYVCLLLLYVNILDRHALW